MARTRKKPAPTKGRVIEPPFSGEERAVATKRVNAAIEHLESAIVITNVVRDVFCSTSDEAGTAIEYLKKDPFYEGDPLETKDQLIGFLDRFMNNEQAKSDALPFTTTFSFLKKVLAQVELLSSSDADMTSNIQGIQAMEKRNLVAFMNQLLAARIVLTTQAKQNSSGEVRYAVNDEKINHRDLKNILTSFNIQQTWIKEGGTIFRLKSEDDARFRRFAHELPPVLEDTSIDPVISLKEFTENAPLSKEPTQGGINERTEKAMDHLRVFIGVIDNAHDIFKIEDNSTILKAAVHSEHEDYVEGKDKPAYLRNRLVKAVKKHSQGRAATLAFKLISDIEDHISDRKKLAEFIETGMHQGLYLSRAIRLEKIGTSPSKDKRGMVVYAVDKLGHDILEIEASFKAYGIDVVSVKDKPGYSQYEITLNKLNADTFDDLCKTISGFLENYKQDPLNSILEKFPYTPEKLNGLSFLDEPKVTENPIEPHDSNTGVNEITPDKMEKLHAEALREDNRRTRQLEREKKAQKQLKRGWLKVFSKALKEVSEVPEDVQQSAVIDTEVLIQKQYDTAVQHSFVPDDLSLEEFEKAYLDTDTTNARGQAFNSYSYHPVGQNAWRSSEFLTLEERQQLRLEKKVQGRVSELKAKQPKTVLTLTSR